MAKTIKPARARKTKTIASKKPFGWVDKNDDRRLAEHQDMARYFPRPDPPTVRDPNEGMPQSEKVNRFGGVCGFIPNVMYRG